jgi:hypothetical protein
MHCELVRERWPDYAAGSVGPSEREAIDRHLAECASCRAETSELGRVWQMLDALPEEEPRPELRARVHAMVDAWREGARAAGTPPPARSWRGRLAWAPAWQICFGVLCVAVGLGAGYAAFAPRANGEIAELRGEVHSMKQMVALSLLQQGSAAERLRGVTWSHDIDQPGSEVIDALLDTLRHDPNVNVRLAAVDALQQFAAGQHRRDLREELIDTILRQDSPLVQLALVDALVDLRERRSAPVLRSLAGDAQANEAVRKRAAWALARLEPQS